MSNFRSRRRPTQLQKELMITGSFNLGTESKPLASWSGKHGKGQEISDDDLSENDRALLFTDLMRVATDRKFASKLESLEHLHEKSLIDQDDTAAEKNSKETILHCGKVLRDNKASKINNSTLLMAAVRANNARAVYLFANCMNKYDDLKGIGVPGKERSKETRSIELVNTIGSTALLLAGEYGYPTIIETLVSAGADFTHVNAYQGSILHLAVEGNHYHAVRRILELLPEYVKISSANAEKTGPASNFWLKEGGSMVPILVPKQPSEVRRDKVKTLERMSSAHEREVTRQAFMQAEIKFPANKGKVFE